MFNIQVTYKGRNYKSLADAATKAIIDGIREVVAKKIRPFESEIRSAGGKVIIDIPDNLKGASVSLKDMPQELIDRIKIAMK